VGLAIIGMLRLPSLKILKSPMAESPRSAFPEFRIGLGDRAEKVERRPILMTFLIFYF